MNFTIIQPMKIPRHKAHTIQVLNTWRAMAHLGHPCMLMVREIQKEVPEVLRFYGLEPEPNLLIQQVRRRNARGTWWRLFVMEASGMLPPPFRKIVYTREVGIALGLLRLRPSTGWRVFLELHTLPSALTEESKKKAKDNREIEKLQAQRKEEKSVEKQVIPSVDGLIYISTGLREMVAEMHGTALPPSVVIPNGAAIGRYPPPPLSERRGIAYVGHWQPNRGMENLINALPFLNEGTITLVGGNDPADVALIKRIIEERGIKERVNVTGCLPPADAREVLLHTRVAVMTSNPHGLVGRVFASHTKLYEYMAAGTAIVAADVPTVRPPLEHMRNALLVPPEDPQEIALAIRRLLQDDTLAETLSRQAYEDARLHSWDHRAAEIYAFTSAVLNLQDV
ncbi:MAG: glycosyltransferase family 4 protein [Deltaproteobacteria bacterium]|nr:glycosyltransferase family 4 protein [Deltaproteobacteria bacterium]MBW2307585.1 glycosyltransferase family 4 protein [Deltaproteobacteria bacterium]